MEEYKMIYGLDVGTNSVGWAVVRQNFKKSEGEIVDLGVRVIPMPGDEISDFNLGNLKSSTSNRTMYRGIRRLRERQLKRRKRLVSVLKAYGMIPEGWRPNQDLSLAFNKQNGITRFRFDESYQEMKSIFKGRHKEIKVIPRDWTIYYLRKKALTEKISLEELGWIVLQFNVKRGYYQLKDEDKGVAPEDQYFVSDIVDEIIDLKEQVKGKLKFKILLRDGFEGEYVDKEKPNWIGHRVDFIAKVRKSKEGDTVELTKPDEEDWALKKKRTESKLEESGKSLGAYIFDSIVEDPGIKIRGKEVHTIDRIWYKEELKQILLKQMEFHKELTDKDNFENAINILYKHNISHKKNLRKYGFEHLIIEDLIYYQRPLKTKKYLIKNCKFEKYFYRDKKGVVRSKPIKATPKSNPYFQEFRIWSTIHNLKVIAEELRNDKGELEQDVDVSNIALNEKGKEKLYDLFSIKKAVSSSQILNSLGLNPKNYRINFEKDKKLPGNTTTAAILSPFTKEKDQKNKILQMVTDSQKIKELWHILYSLRDNVDYMEKAVKTAFPSLSKEIYKRFAETSSFEKEYGSFSEKSLKKLLPLMRVGKYFSINEIDNETKGRIVKVINAEFDETINENVRESLYEKSEIEQFRGLPLHTASYLVYGRHSETELNRCFDSPDQIKVEEILPQHSLRNPTAEQIIRETLKLVKLLWEKHGKPKEIHLEMARELKLPKEKRKEYTKRRNENYNANQRAIAMLNDLKVGQPQINPHSKGHIETFKIYEEGAHAFAEEIENDIKTIRKKGDPTPSEIIRYRLWLEQRYKSPYTGQVIPLSKLFSRAYEIEHVIPKSIFYDDSFNNKIICESEINKFKDNKTAYQMILDYGGSTQNGHRLLDKKEYEELVKKLYRENRIKTKNLLRKEPPYDFAQRQLNNTRFISRKLLELLDPIVRDKDEVAGRSKHLVPMVGQVTHQLKNDWGLQRVWKELLTPRFKRMNQLTRSQDYYEKSGTRIDLSGYESELKRLDHRHHALDALVVACTTRQHIQYINSLRAEKRRYDLERVLFYEPKQGQARNKSGYKLPWKGFPDQAKLSLEKIVISFKNKIRVINKSINYYHKFVKQEDGTYKKQIVKQLTTGYHWAVRQPWSKETYNGKVKVREYKLVNVNNALKYPHLIADPVLRKHIRSLISKFDGKIIEVQNHLKKIPLCRNGKELKKVKVLEYNEYATTKMEINENTTEKQIEKIVDPKTRFELKNHLELYDNVPKKAFSTNGRIEFNADRDLPIQQVTIKENFGKKFPVGETGNKISKFVESAKGTNLFFAVYWNHEKGKREFETIPLYIVLQHQKSVAHLPKNEKLPIPLDSRKGEFLFYLSPSDLVYVPSEEELEQHNMRIGVNEKEFTPSRIYCVESFTGSTCYFLPQTVSHVIKSGIEFESLNKSQRDYNGDIIKDRCWKLVVDRIGEIKGKIKAQVVK